MSVRIYNTLSGQKEPFVPLQENRVNIYVCGITAYDYCHLGHARSTLVFDMIVRYLRHKGYNVTFIRNFTDIDDKIIKRAAEQETSCDELSSRFIKAFHEDMAALGNILPDMEPKATEHIPEIISLIETLITRSMAYATSDGDVYFRVNKFSDYGKLSGRNLEDMQAGARIEVRQSKEHPMDFALWKSSKEGEPAWDSPWGSGRPGWHIECSAMAGKYLGDSFDIHGGGKDLIFPHHENEIAQSEGATGKPFAQTWIHHGFVTIKDEKMSKSLGNFLTIREMLERYPAEALRLFVFSAGYRTPLDFSDQALADAEAGVDRIYASLAAVAALPDATESGSESRVGKKDRAKLEKLKNRFSAAMDNDFNTAQALGHIFDAVKSVNKITQHLPPSPAAADLELVRQGAADIQELMDLLGLITADPQAHMEAKQERLLADLTIKPAEIDELLKERNEARRQKDWQRADEIRDQLAGHSIEIMDSGETSSWQVKM
ncbi:MAG: cysteine--tRNA ligase [Thermodesulfobacteriota bacterium]